MNMELTFPEDAREARARSDRNLSDVRALGVDRRRRRARRLRAVAAEVERLALRRRRRACCFAAASPRTAISTKRSASIRPARRTTRARRCAGRAASTCSKASRSIARSNSSTGSGATSRTCRSSCAISSRSRRSPTRSRTGARRARPARCVEWDAEIFNEMPNKLIAWRSLEGADVVSAGSVNFDHAGGGRGTRVTVHLQYSPPGGKVGAAHREALRRGRRNGDPRRPAPLQAAARSRRSADDRGTAARVGSCRRRAV